MFSLNANLLWMIEVNARVTQPDSINETLGMLPSFSVIPMHSRTVLSATMAIAMTLLVTNAFAWGKEGHQVVARLAGLLNRAFR